MHIRAPYVAMVCAFRALTFADRGRTVHRMTWWRNGCGALLSVGLLVGCGTGGQTGQPTAAGCWKPVALDAPIEGVSGQQLLAAYLGKYTATLHWQGDAGVPADEVITIEISPAPDGVAREANSYPCARLLTVPIEAKLTFADGSVLDSGNATLGATFGSLDTSLSFSGEQRVVSATLRGAPGGVHIEGEVEPDGQDGLTGLFSSDDGAAGGGDR
jgi:hypothetical protein